jgi:hypothetical protein
MKKVTFMYRLKRYGKWEEREVEVKDDLSKNEIKESIIQFLQAENGNVYVEVQDIKFA